MIGEDVKIKTGSVPSIRRQLLSRLMIPIICLCLVSAVISYIIAINIARNAYDGALLESAREVANRVQFNRDRVTLDFPAAAVAIFKEDNIDKFYYAVLDNSGKLIAGDRIIPGNFLSLAKEEKSSENRYFRNGTIGSSAVRIVDLLVPVPNHPGKAATVQVAETTHKRESLANVVLIAVVLPQVVLIALAALTVWIGVEQGLGPLQTVRTAIARRSQWDLSSVSSADAPREIRPLVDALNDLLRRLGQDIETQRRFVSNAAHQLRTPLAGLKTQTELALRLEDTTDLRHALQHMNSSVNRITRLVNQLLSLARAEPNNWQASRYEKLDLNPVAQDITRELVPYAVNKDIDLGFEDSTVPAFIKGDAASLRELISNLIDNAIRYTQEGGKVTVRVYSNEGIHLHVEDNGPGIPDAEKDKVFERFYRVLGNNVSGSGLGLPIVKEISQAHSASVSLRSLAYGRGTIVDVKFPLLAQ